MTIIILAFLMIYLSLQLVFLQNDLESSYTKIDALKIQDEKTLLNPTKDQIIQFLRQDKTDEKEYIKGKYVCTHFSKQLIYNATLAGLNAHYVQIKFSDLNSGHAMVGFQTLDSGFIFVEPQSDEIKDIYIGKKRGNNTISAIHISK
ncbi:MAG: hypothetical protein ACOC5T_08285 [Elusimicrobiota bacterium]